MLAQIGVLSAMSRSSVAATKTVLVTRTTGSRTHPAPGSLLVPMSAQRRAAALARRRQQGGEVAVEVADGALVPAELEKRVGTAGEAALHAERHGVVLAGRQ